MTTSGMTPRATSSVYTSAALPINPMDLGILLLLSFFHKRHRFFESIHDHVHITNGAAAFGAFGVNFNDQSHAFVHRDGQWLRAAHPAETCGEDKFSFERTPAFEFGKRAEGFVGALQNSLRADVDPRTGGHLPVHDESLFGQLIEVFPGCPMRHEV